MMLKSESPDWAINTNTPRGVPLGVWLNVNGSGVVVQVDDSVAASCVIAIVYTAINLREADESSRRVIRRHRQRQRAGSDGLRPERVDAYCLVTLRAVVDQHRIEGG